MTKNLSKTFSLAKSSKPGRLNNFSALVFASRKQRRFGLTEWTRDLSSLRGSLHLALTPFPFHTTTDEGKPAGEGLAWPTRVVIVHVCVCVFVMLYMGMQNCF